ncbi:MAG: peptide MFS transporter [Altererythrobacter sp.]|uniref:peptide MFS transporter n=1 Tax=Altererythrobacter sp. TaxID=1872480 RepID=UPI001B2789C9|nr:peptide MFS transporter [Altererythrobacter sp.]MBO6642364.1 peptide MFS transporter [Altererythrobacter sp.]MBO6709128.1 peptide MFS transporter [Altererythrobacter sp.]
MTLEEIIVAIAATFLVLLLIGGATIVTSKNEEFAGHPKGLFVLFFAEMWERFSYYGMRALLIFYLTQHWLFNDEKASVIYGAYTALVYIAPVLGGYLADRYLGQRKAVLFGAVLLTIGHFLMAFEGEAGTGFQNNPMIDVFWAALAFIIVGSGFLKANISVIVGQLYPRTDIRRDGAYTIFYMGINVGAAVGTIIAGYLGQTYGWAYGFGAAGIGMLLGLIVFIVFKPLLLGKGESTVPEKLESPFMGMKFEWVLYIIGFAAVGITWWLVQNQAIVGTILGVFGLALVAYVVWEAIKIGGHDRDRIFAAMFLIIGSVLFWALFEQAGSSLNLFTDRYVDRQGVSASIFQSINPIYIIMLAPLFAGLWTWLAKKGLEPSTPAKFGLALIQLGAGFLVLVLGANSVGMENMTPVIFIFLIYLLHTTGELCLSPVGLSAMNRLAPAHMASLIMGTWFFASATGNFVAGLIAAATGSEAASGEGAAKETVLAVYSQIGWITVGVGVAVMVISPLIKRLMHLDTLKDDEVLEGVAEAGLEAQEGGIHPATRSSN